MATQDDFLFNLNDFSSGVNHNSNHPTPSSRAHDKSNSNINAHNTNSILAGLNAFTPDDGDMESNASANFADQLALWTNANFSFDGPTGHALLLDDEKEEEAKREERERRDREEAARGGGSGSNSSRRGESSRDGASSNAAAASNAHSAVTTPSVGVVPHTANGHAEPTHRDHKLQAEQQQQQQYFASPASALGEGRRPGYNGNNNAHITDRRRAENDAIRTPTENAFSAFNFLEGQKQQQQQQQPQPQAQNPQQQNGYPLDTNGPYVNGYNAAGVMSPELLQALAFQQMILSGGPQQANGDPMALASLFGGAGGPQLPNGAFSGAVHGGSFVPSVLAGNQPAFGAASGWGFGGHGLPQQNGHGNLVSSSPDVARSDDASGEEGEDHPSNGKKRRQSKRSSNGEESAAARQKREEQEEIAQALRDELPPLELIDTGNPEADAEANRVAIEEDKRRRNTAASARFRIKKKQREQALEQAAKELERRVQDLEEENNRLNTENGWLKSLITIRPSGQSGPAFGPLAGRQMGPGASFIGTGMQPQRDTGLQPRGVGTPNGVGTPDLSRHVTPQLQQQQAANLLAGGKRGRED